MLHGVNAWYRLTRASVLGADLFCQRQNAVFSSQDRCTKTDIRLQFHGTVSVGTSRFDRIRFAESLQTTRLSIHCEHDSEEPGLRSAEQQFGALAIPLHRDRIIRLEILSPAACMVYI